MNTSSDIALKINSLHIQKITFDKVFMNIQNSIKTGEKQHIAFCNAHTALLALRDDSYCDALSKMTVLNDGIGIDIASWLLNGSFFPENLNGTDFIPRLLSQLNISAKIYLLGSTQSVVKKAANLIADTYPEHHVVGYHDGYFSDQEKLNIIEEINKSGADILLVAMGNPIQEKFIIENSNSLNCKVAIGVGALFDFMSGHVHRAPKQIQQLRLEWLFRLVQEPKRLLKRYCIGIPTFLWAISIYHLKQQKLPIINKI